MKLLVVIGLVVLLVFLLYRRLRPYIKIVRNFINTLRAFQVKTDQATRASGGQREKLVCCVACGTWVPSGRALAAGTGSAVFCSAECLRAGKNKP